MLSYSDFSSRSPQVQSTKYLFMFWKISKQSCNFFYAGFKYYKFFK